MTRDRCLRVLLALTAAIVLAGQASANPSFEAWVRQLRPEATAQGVSAATFDAAFAGLQPLPRVIELYERQPEVKLSFDEYLARVVPPTRIERGRQLLKENRPLLDQIGAQYGVPSRLIVALWGVESDYGNRQGDYNVIAALATLSWSGKRAAFFKQELIAALKIVDQGHATAPTLLGSWAGALGQCQFMPSNFLRLTVDHDGDGRRDIWRSRPDVFASIANYMNKVHWRTGQSWGREVRLPARFPVKAHANARRKLDEWQKLGLRRQDGGDLPTAAFTAQLVLPQGSERAFLVYDNHRAILAWNRSTFFALAVGQLMDALED
ncbi:MAG: lytic transglycosylase domain-containing protein [Reyranellaceae bacterium]